MNESVGAAKLGNLENNCEVRLRETLLQGNKQDYRYADPIICFCTFGCLRCPYGLPILPFGIYEAAGQFNDGKRSTADIFKEAGIEPGHHTLVACRTSDQYRVKQGKHQSMGETKHLCKKIWAATKTKNELVAAKKSPSYEPGSF